jgi:hypothetical protein
VENGIAGIKAPRADVLKYQHAYRYSRVGSCVKSILTQRIHRNVPERSRMQKRWMHQGLKVKKSLGPTDDKRTMGWWGGGARRKVAPISRIRYRALLVLDSRVHLSRMYIPCWTRLFSDPWARQRVSVFQRRCLFDSADRSGSRDDWMIRQSSRVFQIIPHCHS